MSGSFCSEPNFSWPFDGPPLTHAACCHVNFDMAHFSSTEFARYKIDMPPRLRTAVAKRQAEFLAGRICARAALMAIGHVAVVPGINSDRSPSWPSAIVGAITHDTCGAAAVVAPASKFWGVGIDCELITALIDHDEIAADILTSSEAEIYRGLLRAERARYLALAFSTKECLFKALYPLVGRYFDFHSARLLGWDEGDGTAQLELCITLSAQWPAGRRFSARFMRTDERVMALLAIPR